MTSRCPGAGFTFLLLYLFVVCSNPIDRTVINHKALIKTWNSRRPLTTISQSYRHIPVISLPAYLHRASGFIKTRLKSHVQYKKYLLKKKKMKKNPNLRDNTGLSHYDIVPSGSQTVITKIQLMSVAPRAPFARGCWNHAFLALPLFTTMALTSCAEAHSVWVASAKVIIA